MTRKHYDWINGPASLKQHSVAKHKLLRSYLSDYFLTLLSSPSQEELRLTIIDGFAGGGLYQHESTGELMAGSPLICLEETALAEARTNTSREKPIHFNVDFIFVEEDKKAAAFLRETLRQRGYLARLGRDIHLFEGDFNAYADRLIAHAKKKTPRSGRALFVLDQYGYSDVPMELLSRIFEQLPRAEVILTFGVDSFNTYVSDKNASALLRKVGLADVFQGRSLSEIKENERDWRAYIQSQLYPYVVRSSGARFHTPFFIRSQKGHGDFWLLHLSMHQKARDVMTEVHWKHSNTFIHYGGEGFDMFKVGYIVNADERFTKQQKLGYEFDDDARTRTIERLSIEMPVLIHAHDDGQSFESLHAATCNDSPATANIYREVLSKLAKQGEIEIVSPDGSRKTAASQIRGEDRLLPSRQKKLF